MTTKDFASKSLSSSFSSVYASVIAIKLISYTHTHTLYFCLSIVHLHLMRTVLFYTSEVEYNNNNNIAAYFPFQFNRCRKFSKKNSPMNAMDFSLVFHYYKAQGNYFKINRYYFAFIESCKIS